MSTVTVLGSCGGWPEPGRASSSFLVEHDGFRVVLDLGYGVLSRLLAELDSARADGLDAAIVTHSHADHVADLHGLYRALRLGGSQRTPLPLYAGPGVVEAAQALEAGDPASVREVLDVHPLPAAPYEVGPFTLESLPLPHHVPNAGVRIMTTGLTIAYTGDTGPTPALAELGRDADLYIVDATDGDQQSGDPAPPDALNLTGRQAGEAAAAARAERLLLTHFWPGNDRAATVAAAAAVFPGEVIAAEEGHTIIL
jgi:ribonuclease BN (tRNA processing enzyme)